ncbi:TolC family protein [Membranihabitans maritimus]|uniref:TolC family protein n=1 Tax=Membranihabitans maritimus TaxID=2904244 RepID=UPI001F4763E1|nr:TolC family protein [Membranihabitans maritimus]
MIKFIRSFPLFLTGILILFIQSCKIPELTQKEIKQELPENFISTQGNDVDTINSARIPWKEFFNDPYLTDLIDTALVNNKEINILLQRISIAKNEIFARKGEYKPFINAGAGLELEKVGHYTRNGAVEENLEIEEGKPFPELLGNLDIGLFASWELDVWQKLRNSSKVAVLEYMATLEGKNFMITNLVAEIAKSYYELLALDNTLDNLKQSIRIQENVLEVVKTLKDAGRTTSLAVKRFEAEVKKNQSEIYAIKQEIIVTENTINFLLGRPAQNIPRNSDSFNSLMPKLVENGIPSQLLENRPDIRQAELELQAAELNIQVAKANFYPSFDIRAGLGFEAFNPKFLLATPKSLAMSIAGDAVAPLVNRNAIISVYNNANAKQIQVAYEYEQTILNAFFETKNQISNINNLNENYALKTQQVNSLSESIEIVNQLFRSARADYMEVLLTQREAMESKFELIETKKEQLIAVVDLYKALGGGWQ